jgi:hypothetical protein
MKHFLLAGALMISTIINAQSKTPPCSAPQASQFNFWIGEWDLTWSDSLHGTNRVEKIFGDCTVHENFNDAKNNYAGQSWSVYNPASSLWQQTWVDNQGGYITLTGKMENDSIILKTGERQTQKGKQQMRMVYYHIQQGSFDWSWESSNDGGASWKPVWQIHYSRKK